MVVCDRRLLKIIDILNSGKCSKPIIAVSLLIALGRDVAILYLIFMGQVDTNLPLLYWIFYCILQFLWTYVPWILLNIYFYHDEPDFYFSGYFWGIAIEKIADCLLEISNKCIFLDGCIEECDWGYWRILQFVLFYIYIFTFGIILTVSFASLILVPYIIILLVKCDHLDIQYLREYLVLSILFLTFWGVSNYVVTWVLDTDLFLELWYVNIVYGLFTGWLYFTLNLHVWNLRKYSIVFNPLVIFGVTIFILIMAAAFVLISPILAICAPLLCIIVWCSKLKSIYSRNNDRFNRNESQIYHNLSSTDSGEESKHGEGEESEHGEGEESKHGEGDQEDGVVNQTTNQQNINHVECVICKDSIYLHNERDYAVLPCGHIFHYECIDDWIGIRGHNSCPIDRRQVLRHQIVRIMI